MWVSSYIVKIVDHGTLWLIKQRDMNMEHFDVVIVGGGMIGSAMAIGSAQLGLSVAVIEGKAPIPFSDDQPMDLRVSAISAQTEQLLAKLGAWEQIQAQRVCPFRRLETWEHLDCRTRFSSEDLNLERLGVMVENRVVQLGLWDLFKRYPSIKVYCPHHFSHYKSLSDSETARYQVTLKNGESFTTKVILGADGANSVVRKQMGVGLTGWDYRQRCLLIQVETEQPQQDITWQHFSPSGPRAFLPLVGHQACLVWYDTPERIAELESLSLSALCDEIHRNFPSELGRIKVNQRGSFPLTRRHAQQYVKSGIVLLGDAAHAIHPLAGQGVNLGFKDAKVLLEEWQKAGDNWDSIETLSRYEKRRRTDNLLMQTSMDLLYKTFRQSNRLAFFGRNLGLKLAENAGPLKNKALKYALGLS